MFIFVGLICRFPFLFLFNFSYSLYQCQNSDVFLGMNSLAKRLMTLKNYTNNLTNNYERYFAIRFRKKKNEIKN